MPRRKKNDDYWESEEFEKDQDVVVDEPKKESKNEVEEKEAPSSSVGPTTLGGMPNIQSSNKKKNQKKKKKADQKQKSEDTPENNEQKEEPKSQEKEIKDKNEKGEKSKKEEEKEEKTSEKEQQEETLTSSQEQTETATSGEGKKKKKKKKAAAEPTAEKKEPEKKEASKKSAMAKKIQQALQAQKEEEERLRKLEEERLKKLEEEEERLRQEREREEALRLEKKKKKKEKEKEKKKTKKQEIDPQALLRQFGAGVTIGATEQKKKPVYEKLKKPNKKNKQQEEQQAKEQEEKKKEQEKVQEQEKGQQNQEEKKNEPLDNWEEAADNWEEVADNWEDLENKPEEKKVHKEEKKTEEKKQVVDEKGDANNNRPQKKKTEEQKTEAASEGLRSPICCVLGHVDTGKTKILDKIRKTHIQQDEAGGITQQIGATFFPMEALKEQTSKLSKHQSLAVKVPGLLIIDTPGHESFTNLRSRGSSLCDIAVLVVDIMHGLEPQTIESIELLKRRKTPFIVALNKVDRIYNWKPRPNSAIQATLKAQEAHVRQEFDQRVQDTITYFAEQSLNAVLYYKNKDFRKYVSLVPTSAHTGEGIPDLLMLLVQLTQNLMSQKLLYLSELQCTVLEVKVVEGLGTTIDVILVNGVLREGDTIVLCGLNGPIVTTIRALLTPPPLKEIRTKSQYIHHKEVKASQGVKISAQNLEHTIAGSSLLVYKSGDDIEDLKEEVMADLEAMRHKTEKTDRGVYVQASTLGSLEALLDFLKDSKIPVSAINIGPVNKSDVMKASVMLEHAKEYAVILAFDVKISKDARELAEKTGVKIFSADIIYHLFDSFTNYMQQIEEERRNEAQGEAVFPCRLKIIPEFVFNKKDPIVVGVEVMEGVLKVGTPICVPSKDFIPLGKVTSIERNRIAVDEAKRSDSVAIKIELPITEQKREFGRHFTADDELVSRISRKSIDLLKTNFRKELEENKEYVICLKKLKSLFKIL